MILKEKYEQFKSWQRRPTEFPAIKDEEHECQCCGHHYKGNFCPRCSQKANVGIPSWESVRQSLMDIWDLGARTMPHSVWQLLTRPGYFISEYINGKRQVSFPPVKMLFVVAILYSIIFYLFFPNVLGLEIDSAADVYSWGGEEVSLTDRLLEDWIKKYLAWYTLLLSMILVLPTWILFRNSPRNTHHTLPKGFFIQVFMATLTLVIGAISNLFVFLGASFSLYLGSGLIIIFYYIAYRQIFGYGAWSTIWRQILMYICGFLILIMFILPFSVEDDNPEKFEVLIFAEVMFIILSAGVFYLCHRINKWACRRSERRAEQNGNKS